MTNQSDEPGGIGDDRLPEDLQPTDDNPLAQPLEPGEGPEVDLNEPSGTYQRQLEEEEAEDAEESDGSGASDDD